MILDKALHEGCLSLFICHNGYIFFLFFIKGIFSPTSLSIFCLRTTPFFQIEFRPVIFKIQLFNPLIGRYLADVTFFFNFFIY